jgi:hypothetical protein
MILIRQPGIEAGVFGMIKSKNPGLILSTLEHAYAKQSDLPNGPVSYVAKIPQGTYKCVLGEHSLEHSVLPFKTYEITNVPGHTGCLFHPGNTEADSAGCVLLGLSKENNEILNSREAFTELMSFQNGAQEFNLTISEGQSST